jgi:lysozyme family protein
MVPDRFLVALRGTVLPHEGRRVNDPDDPGGATDYGISLRFLQGEDQDIDGDGDVDADDVWALEDADVERLYRQFFWAPMHGDFWSSPAVAAKLFDLAVNVGPLRAVKIAQEASGAHVDGLLGPQTYRAINTPKPAEILPRICAAQLGFYRAIVERRPRSAKFLPGWTVRAGCTLLEPCRICRKAR